MFDLSERSEAFLDEPDSTFLSGKQRATPQDEMPRLEFNPQRQFSFQPHDFDQLDAMPDVPTELSHFGVKQVSTVAELFKHSPCAEPHAVLKLQILHCPHLTSLHGLALHKNLKILNAGSNALQSTQWLE